MPKTDDPIVYRYTGHADEGEALTGIPGRSLRRSDLDAMDEDQKARLKHHLDGEHRHIYSEVEPDPIAEAVDAVHRDKDKDKAADAPAPRKAKAAGSDK